MKTFVIGDIHGQADALIEVLKESNFDYDKDKLIVLGDVVDGGLKSFEVIEELLKIKNLVYIYGNHCYWFINWFKYYNKPMIWTSQGGRATIDSYGKHNYTVDSIPVTHQDFFNRGVYYHIENNMVFVHGGFNPAIALEKEKEVNLLWDRKLIWTAKSGRPIRKIITKEDLEKPKEYWEHVFVGHTTTSNFRSIEPITYENLTMMDTGAGWEGKLTIMDINTREYWQSDFVPTAKRGEE